LAVMAAVCIAGAGYQWFGSAILCVIFPVLFVMLVGFAVPKRAVEVVVVVAIIGLVIALLLPAVRPPGGGPSKRGMCSNNLKQIWVALQNYHDVYHSVPPAYVADANGKPMHS